VGLVATFRQLSDEGKLHGYFQQDFGTEYTVKHFMQTLEIVWCKY
jgi:hypothetical protein